MGQLIDFTAFRNARRVETVIAHRETVKKEANQARRQAGYDLFNNNPAGQMLVDAVCAVAEQDEERKEAERPPVAYCNPSNEWRGSKYEATQGLSRKEIAARIREDIKAAKKAGLISAEIKISVRCDAHSIDVRVTAVPEGFRQWNPEYVAWRQANPHGWDCPIMACDQLSAEWSKLRAVLKEIHGAYNRDNSDSMSDYFDVRYYGDIEIHWELARELRQREGL